jgi:hypothetical protein
MSRILEKSFRYVPASKTDIRKTFARIRQQMKQQAPQTNVKPLIRVKAA